MLAVVVTSHDVRHAGRQMLLGELRIAQLRKAPRARQAQPVEVAVLGVGVVKDDRRLGERARVGKKRSHPRAELAVRKQVLHQQCLDQRGGEEVVRRRLVLSRVVAIVQVPALCRRFDLPLESRAADDS